MSTRRRVTSLLGFGLFAALALRAPHGRSADDTFGLGNGKDAAFVAGAAGQIVNAYSAVVGEATVGATSIAVSDTTEFDVGDLVLVVQMKSGELTSQDADPAVDLDLAAIGVGQYEVVTVVSKTIESLDFTPPLVHAYAATGAQVVRIPQYTTVNVPAGTSVTAKPWDGTTGGVVAFVATGAITMEGDGTVTADALGFRGGRRSKMFCADPCTISNEGSAPLDDASCDTGGRGESFDGTVNAFGEMGCGVGARGSGGGGGGHINAGGAGGGNAGYGGRGGRGWNQGRLHGGYAGAGTNAPLLERLTFGGGGGGGQTNNSESLPEEQSRGGAGGGIVFLRGLSLSTEAPITANGQAGNHGISDGAGGGGAGGSVLIRIVDAADCSVHANGGAGGNINNHGAGGGGGAGRVRIESRGGTCPVEATPGTNGTDNLEPVTGPNAPATAVEDTAGEHYGCLDSASCPGTQPICDATTKLCRGCDDNAECATGYCSPSGACTVAPEDASADGGATEPDAGDAGTDAGALADGGASDGGVGTDGGSSGTTTPDADVVLVPAIDGAETLGGGCDCRTTPARSASRAGLLGFAVALVLAASRRSRGRRG